MLVGVLLLMGPLSTRGALAALFGAGVAAVNALLAHAVMRWSDHRPTGDFVKLLLGGMAGRMALVLGAVALGVTALDLPRLSLLLSLLIHFGLFLGAEMVALHGFQHPSTASR
jgi:hypothetical protein